MSRSHVMSRSHTIEHWDPEDTAQWESGGRRTAMRNLYWSVFAEHVGFSMWTLFAVMVLFMPQDVYGLDAPDKFLVSAVVTLTGAFLRIPYTLATARFGGRNWTMFSAFVLLVPALGCCGSWPTRVSRCGRTSSRAPSPAWAGPTSPRP